MDAAEEAEQRKNKIMNDATNICSKVEKWLDSNTTEYNICWDDIGDNDSRLTPSYCKSIWERLTLEKYLGNQRENRPFLNPLSAVKLFQSDVQNSRQHVYVETKGPFSSNALKMENHSYTGVRNSWVLGAIESIYERKRLSEKLYKETTKRTKFDHNISHHDSSIIEQSKNNIPSNSKSTTYVQIPNNSTTSIEAHHQVSVSSSSSPINPNSSHPHYQGAIAMSPYPAPASASNYMSCYTQSSSALPNSVNCNQTSPQDVSRPQSNAYAANASNNTHANSNATSTSSQLSTSTLATAGYTNTPQVMWTQFMDTLNQAPNINGFPSTLLYQFLLSPGMGMNGMYPPPQASSSASLSSSSTMPIPQVRMTSSITSAVLENGKSSSVLNSSPTSTASNSCAPVNGNVSLTSPISPPESTNQVNVVLTQLSTDSTPTEAVPAENVACVDEAI